MRIDDWGMLALALLLGLVLLTLGICLANWSLLGFGVSITASVAGAAVYCWMSGR